MKHDCALQKKWTNLCALPVASSVCISTAVSEINDQAEPAKVISTSVCISSHFCSALQFSFQFSLLSLRFQSRRACFKLSFYGLNMFSLSVSLVFLFWDYLSWAWLKKVRTCITIQTHGSQPCGHSSLSKHNVLLMFVVLTFLNKYTKTKACFNCNYFSKDVVLFQ